MSESSIGARSIDHMARVYRDRCRMRKEARELWRQSASLDYQDAVRLADAGYGWQDIVARLRIPEKHARLLVMGTE
jgi:hypothetical protein